MKLNFKFEITKVFLFLVFSYSLLAYPNFVYLDGNGNQYQLDQTHFSYKPILPIESSSGFYSGGDPKKIQLTIKQKQEIEKLFERISKTKENEKGKFREKGTGLLIYTEKENRVEILYKKDSKTKKQIEKILTSIKN